MEHLIDMTLCVVRAGLWSEASVIIDRRLRLRASTTHSTSTPATTRALAVCSGDSAGGSADPCPRAAAGAMAAPVAARQEVLAAGGGGEDRLGGGWSRVRA